MKFICNTKENRRIIDIMPGAVLQVQTSVPIITFIGGGNCLSNQIYETEITVLDVQGSILENPSEKGELSWKNI